MPRAARVLPEEGVFHVMCRGNNRQEVFRSREDFEKYMFLLRQYQEEHGFRLFHYCLMSNHVHLLLETRAKTNLPKLMKQLNMLYMHYFRKKYKYWGHFWQDRYKSILVEKNEYLMTCGKYIELNPVRAKMVDEPEQYEWSSYRAYIGRKEDALVAFDPLFEGLGKTREERSEKYKTIVCQDIDENAKYFGSQTFIEQMEELFGIRNVTRKKGRPRKE